MSSIENFEAAKARLSFAAAILHTFDLDGLARVHERVTSPQALIDGFGLSGQATAENWLAVVKP